ncbi:MAG: MotA/TolQ/ExbB proton channel family protein [Fusobacterium mortiferum]|mgnify:FL=1|uniref:MotA/TolQ/ExbB proton channel family protein n=1 Tax=uncultured Fusobacterium sp. TaxID=159267 RepID=UPI002597B595|nr:MotA/TolQ/ExbB proton channel family protein [uncultured Fusobacterium sp.]MDD7261920.1 MotA/TolQ/ExbB proton channel family protein [Fusobacterium mortiferum]MDY5981480.1 MotA/TolQ/ExbB proton channel family protein [Fusobacterium mortiferum]
MYQYFIEGGMMMWLLGALSILGLGTILERTAYFLKNERDLKGNFKDEIIKLVRAGEEEEAIKLCERTNNSVSRTVKSILLAYKYENDMYESKEKLMKEKALEQIENLERRLSILGIVSYISPMAGLLGTVLGMIKSFKAIAIQGAGDPNVVANGISEALITTAAGLLIAIPAIIAYNLFNRKADKIMMEIEKTSTALINIKKNRDER